MIMSSPTTEMGKKSDVVMSSQVQEKLEFSISTPSLCDFRLASNAPIPTPPVKHNNRQGEGLVACGHG